MNQKKFFEPVTQVDCDAVAAQLRNSNNQTERDRLVAIAKRRGFLLPASFTADVTRALQASRDLATFSSSGDPLATMSEDRVELMAKTDYGRAMLAKMNLKANPAPIPGGEALSDGERNRYLACTREGREVLKRRGFDSMAIERLQHPR